MKKFSKISICIVVILVAIVVASLIYNGQEKETSGNTSVNNTTNTNTINSDNDVIQNDETHENTDYVGKEENTDESEELEEDQRDEKKEQQVETNQEHITQELTGKDKAIDIVKKEYALEGQTVRFDHMEGENYIIKINDGTAVTWYLVDGTTWEAEEY